MISTTWIAAAPADLLGLGCSDMRPHAAVLVKDSSAFAQGTAAFATVGTAGAAARLRPTTSQVVPVERLHVIAPDYFAQNDGTTLGIPPSRRPQS